MLFLLLAAAVPQTPPAAPPRTPVEAERAFAADARTLGQWTAFRQWAAADATMFLPQPANAQAALRDWRDPPRAIVWSPAASFMSCDGTLAANMGPWRRPDGSVGFFSTVWRRGAEGWRWIVDGGDALATPRPAVAQPAVRRAACRGRPVPLPVGTVAGERAGEGYSTDRTLRWRWSVAADGARRFRVDLWNGRSFDGVVDDHIAAPPPPSVPAAPAPATP